MYEYKFSEKHVRYMKEQIWQIESIAKGDLAYYSRLSDSEYSIIKDYIEGDINTVMDLGCGLGRAGINIYHMLKKEPKMFFCDSDFTADKHGGSFLCKDGKVGDYNSIDMTEDFVKTNNVDSYNIINLGDEDPFSDLPKMDLIISMYSVGFHFRISSWFDKLSKVINEDTILIFCLFDSKHFKLANKRSETDNVSAIIKQFSSSKIVTGLKKGFPQCDYLILKGYKK